MTGSAWLRWVANFKAALSSGLCYQGLHTYFPARSTRLQWQRAHKCQWFATSLTGSATSESPCSKIGDTATCNFRLLVWGRTCSVIHSSSLCVLHRICTNTCTARLFSCCWVPPVGVCMRPYRSWQFTSSGGFGAPRSNSVSPVNSLHIC